MACQQQTKHLDGHCGSFQSAIKAIFLRVTAPQLTIRERYHVAILEGRGDSLD